MSKLILVTHREPFALRRTGATLSAERQTAGLLGALDPIVRATSGTWISWSGFERDVPRAGKSQDGLPERFDVRIEGQNWSLRRLPLSEREASLYHYGWACRTQWPLMHLMLGHGTFDPEAWRAFKRVNQRFCDAILDVYEPGDRVWIHEHNLALVPGLLRSARPDMPIGYTWNIPWPPLEVLAAMPWAAELIGGVLGASQIGVGLPRYARNFVAAAEALCGARRVDGFLAAGRPEEGRGWYVHAEAPSIESAGEYALLLGEHTTRIAPLPLGCDVELWSERARAARGGRAIRLKRNLGAERLALAVDRVDGTRGIAERIRAVERFFDRYPSWRGRLVFCQVAVPSRTRVEEYREMKREIDELVGRVNQRFGTESWMPVRYLYKVLEPDELAVHYVAADVLVATPLSDGIGFVPFEYVASRLHGDGALLLSSLAGTAELLPEALQINPYDEDAVAGALHVALESRPAETEARMTSLRERVRACDLRPRLDTFWQAAFSERLPVAVPSQPRIEQELEPSFQPAP